jgi:hypothetical protein
MSIEAVNPINAISFPSEPVTPREPRLAAPLSEEEQKMVTQLKARDREVRQHEQAHLAVAGRYAKGGIHFEYQRGPDGRQYAIGGHVTIDTTEIPGDPQATIEKMRTVKRAALAPREPSAADRAAARKADQKTRQAQQEIQSQGQTQETQTSRTPASATPTSSPYAYASASQAYGLVALGQVNASAQMADFAI